MARFSDLPENQNAPLTALDTVLGLTAATLNTCVLSCIPRSAPIEWIQSVISYENKQ